MCWCQADQHVLPLLRKKTVDACRTKYVVDVLLSKPGTLGPSRTLSLTITSNRPYCQSQKQFRYCVPPSQGNSGPGSSHEGEADCKPLEATTNQQNAFAATASRH